MQIIVINKKIKKIVESACKHMLDAVVKRRISLRRIHSWLYKHRIDYIN